MVKSKKALPPESELINRVKQRQSYEQGVYEGLKLAARIAKRYNNADKIAVEIDLHINKLTQVK